MTTLRGTHPIVHAAAQRLSEAVAEAFTTADIGDDLFTHDVFLDGHPPFWRFQLHGVEALAAWFASYAPHGVETTAVRTVATASGFVTEFSGRHDEAGQEMTDRTILLFEVWDGRISELTIYCSGDWDEELRSRHGAETTTLRP